MSVDPTSIVGNELHRRLIMEAAPHSIEPYRVEQGRGGRGGGGSTVPAGQGRGHLEGLLQQLGGAEVDEEEAPRLGATTHHPSPRTSNGPGRAK